jgi:CheY-like chemotaxis protein
MAAKPVLLCIDDEPTGLMFRRLMLESAGYQVRTATSGLEGLQLLHNEQIDAVVLDYYMPGLDGCQVARRMRQVRPRVPILLLSAYVYLPEEVLSLVDAHITKGQPVDLLLTELADLLDGNHLCSKSQA